MKMKTENHGWFFLWGLLTLVSFCFIGCKDDDGGEKGGTPFDPGKPVVISDFTPKEGGIEADRFFFFRGRLGISFIIVWRQFWQ